jgi:hypothetical protein
VFWQGKNRLIAKHSLWGENGPITEHYEQGGKLAFVLLQWVDEQLFPMFKPLKRGMTLPTCGDFVALTLCNQELYNVSRQGSFSKFYKKGCIERDNLSNEKWVQILQAWRVWSVLRSLHEVASLMIVHHSTIMAFHENPLMRTILA